MGAPLRVLLVADSENDALLLLRQLKRGGYEPSSRRVDTPGEMEAALEAQAWDLVISDHNMPAFNSLAALDLLRSRGFVDLPFIIVSGRIGEDAAVSAMKAGAHDYIMKDNLARLNTAIERELREAEVRRERRRAMDEIGRQARLLSLTQDAIMVCDLKGTLRFWNTGAEMMYGWGADEALGSTAPELMKTVYPEPVEQIGHKLMSSRGDRERDPVGLKPGDQRVAHRHRRGDLAAGRRQLVVGQAQRRLGEELGGLAVAGITAGDLESPLMTWHDTIAVMEALDAARAQVAAPRTTPDARPEETAR